VMLQQTQVERVVPKWTAFLDRFPTPADCADAALGDVLRLWQGLGYPRRAKYLHATARLTIDRHDGALPNDLDQLLALPGVGAYTARAVLAFAFERDIAAVDTNIARILARVTGGSLTTNSAQRTADGLVPQGRGWEWNQVLMDLGAQLCRPIPKCASCPLARSCVWLNAGRPDPDPAVGSAGVSTAQARFEGSPRQARGRVLKALGNGALSHRGFEEDIVAGLLSDGLIERVADQIRLPSSPDFRSATHSPYR
jgi:A/G-specific adenine glycosylase